MKKIMLLLAVLFAGTTILSAQNTDLQKWVQKDGTYYQAEKKAKSPKVSNVIKDAGFYLEKSANYQYAAIGLAGVGVLTSTIGSVITIRDSDYYLDDEDYKKQKRDNNTRKACYIGAGVCAIAAICCEIASINYKLKAGRSLQMFTTGTGGGLAYTF